MIKSVLVSCGVALLSEAVAGTIHVASDNPLLFAVAGGTAIGTGSLALARHGAGVGGTGIVTLWLLRERGWNAGRTQMAIDGGILLMSIATLSLGQLAWSALSAVSVSGVILVWHRPDRYIAT